MSADVLGYLMSKGAQVKKAGGWEFNMACFFCGEDPQARGRLYVNTDPDADIPGLFECKLCGAHGAFPTIQRHFGDQPTSQKDDERWIGRREIFAEAASYYHTCLAEHPEAYRWLRGPERGLTLETIQTALIGYADGGLRGHLWSCGYRTADMLETGLVVEYQGKVQDALRDMITIPYFVAGNVVTIRGRKWPFDGTGSKYKTLPGNSVRLFNSDATWDTSELILTEGEFDALILRQLGFTNVVASPGAGVWQDAWDGYLANVRRVFAVFDNDAAGNKGLAKLLERYGSKIKPVALSATGKTDPTSWVAAGGSAEEFQRLIRSSAGGLLVTVDEAEEEHASLQGTSGIAFGFPKLDVTIAPGLLPSQVMVVLAKAGCLAGDTMIQVNRCGNGFRIPISKMYDRWSGQKYAWDHSSPTYVQRAVDGVVRLGRVDEVWESGVKETFVVTTDAGRVVRATAEHPFLTPDGWTKLADLEIGSQVLVNLEVLTHEQHRAEHAGVWANNVLEQIGVETVVSVKRHGFEMTYDISVADEPHNFMANGFVVHNTGKSIFLLNLFQRIVMQDGQQNFKLLFLSLEQTRGDWWERARRIYRFYNTDADDREALDFWRERIMLVDKNRLREEDLIAVLDDYEDRMGQPPDLVAIDYLGYWANGFRGDRYERVSDAIMSLKAVGKERRLPIITPHQVSRVAKYGEEPDADAARDAGVVEETADFLLTMWSPDAQLGRKEEDKSGIVSLRVGKSRHGGRGVRLDMQFAPLTLALVPEGDLLQQRARNELTWERENQTWEDAIFAHRTGVSGSFRRPERVSH